MFKDNMRTHRKMHASFSVLDSFACPKGFAVGFYEHCDGGTEKECDEEHKSSHPEGDKRVSKLLFILVCLYTPPPPPFFSETR